MNDWSNKSKRKMFKNWQVSLAKVKTYLNNKMQLI